MVKLRDHEQMKALWPPYIEGPHSFWDKHHPGGEWGELIRVKWVVPESDPPYISLFVKWDDVDFRTAFSHADPVFLKKLYETLKSRGIGKTLEEVGNLQVDF